MFQRFQALVGLVLPVLSLAGAELSAAEQRPAPLSFIEPASSRAAEGYAYVARVPGYTTYLRGDEAVFLASPAHGMRTGEPEHAAAAAVRPLRMRLLGGRAQSDADASGLLPGHSNYLRGPDPREWQRGIPHFRTVRFSGVYPGVDVVYTVNSEGLRYDFLVSPDGDPETIRVQFDGGVDAHVDAQGALRVDGDHGDFIHTAPVIYQELEGERREIAGGFALDDDGTLRFRVAGRDSTPVSVADAGSDADPRIEFATYLGGSGSDVADAVTLDAAGRIYVLGDTLSLDFPTVDPLQAAPAGSRDLLVARISADAQTLEYATYIGGSLDEFGNQITVDAAGNVLAAGYTYSPDFPSVNAFQPVFAGGLISPFDGFLLKLVATGDALVYSTYVGSPDPPEPFFAYDMVRGLTLDALGNAYITGEAGSAEFPQTHQLQGRGCFEDEAGLVSPVVGDAFVAKVAPDGALVFSTCLGGSERDTGRGIALGPGGSIYVTGYSRSEDYPVTASAYQATIAGLYDGHVTRLNASATVILSATFIGGSDNEFPQSIRVAADGSSFVAGQTAADFPTTPGAFQTDCHNSIYDADVFVFHLTANASSLLYSTCLGGADYEFGYGMDIDAAGHAYFAGQTRSTDLPLSSPTQAVKGATAGITAEIGPPADTHALALASLYDDGRFVNVLVAGAEGIDRVYDIDQYGTVDAARDLGPQADRTRAVAFFDVDGALPLDMIVTGNDDAPNRLYRSDGAGGFLPPQDVAPEVHATRAVVLADFRGSSDPDLVVGNHLEPMLLYPGTTNGFGPGITAFPGSASTATTSLLAGDFNSDGLRDVLQGTDGQGIRIYISTGSAFTPGVIGDEIDTTVAIAAGDVDSDFDLDVFAGNTGAPNRLYRNRGNGIFDAATDLDATAASTTSVTLTDYDGDGDLDAIAADAAGGALYVNDATGAFTRLAFAAPDEAAQAQAVTIGFVFNAPPTAGAIRQLSFDTSDAFAAVLDATGSRLLFSTYVGGAGGDSASWGMKADSGAFYIAGATAAADFTTVAALQPVSGGLSDAFVMKIVLDADTDGLLDAEDNCTEIANADQRDTNGDGFGNVCDPDLNDDGIVNFVDLGLMKAAFFGTDADADLNGDGNVNFVDLGTLKQFFFQPPGPSGVASEPADRGRPAQPR